MVNFILNNFRGSAPGIVFARTEHIGVITLPLIADQLLQLFKGQTSNAGKPTLALAC
ncbi:Uncharacterised protein [Salmonella enterica subsp. enterica serovar Bovismorbificans]|uniref:Uncharacterized protein n=1 Tax=Salmonella enterica subsp. enterica serovar Bovismorbificans TaxID=58097 RepID=A0A655BNE9_SALET|nr:Uncharacterised protein [Salmonella enterica subsp. enterica serovar Bovismorbificans]CNT65612.1 Uncharacterised protein [Salmonella enterica subsp. enterica serovar Bovismorbificans]CPR42157.1 Uncharacterised protein [Salmonella enterica subsp. enterica serovar Bovismorbificans]